MFYIVTYATHADRYFDLLKQSCPDIVVLGFGEKWHGLYDKVKATVNFCKSKQPDDIVCFVDGFDSVILTSKEEILEKYKSFDAPLVFSQGASSSSIFVKYTQDKLYGKCKDTRLNSGMIIGTAESIVDFWKNMEETEEDQTYATRTCNQISYMKIDDEHKMFYNYSSADTIDVKKGSIYVNGNKHRTSIISCPGNNNINHILTQLNYKHLPDIQSDFKYRFSTYAKYFIKEVGLAVLIVGIFIYFKNLSFSLFLSIILFSAFLEYEIVVKHLDITPTHKILYVLVDIIHLFILFGIFYLLVNFECNIQKLLLVNIIYFISIASFFIMKQCILTIFTNHLSNKPNCAWNGPLQRLAYLINVNKSYETPVERHQDFAHLWMKGNIKTVLIFIFINVNCLWKISTCSSCIPKNGFGKIDFMKRVRTLGRSK